MLSVALACVYVGVQTDDEQGTKKEAKLIQEKGHVHKIPRVLEPEPSVSFIN